MHSSNSKELSEKLSAKRAESSAINEPVIGPPPVICSLPASIWLKYELWR